MNELGKLLGIQVQSEHAENFVVSVTFNDTSINTNIGVLVTRMGVKGVCLTISGRYRDMPAYTVAELWLRYCGLFGDHRVDPDAVSVLRRYTLLLKELNRSPIRDEIHDERLLAYAAKNKLGLLRHVSLPRLYFLYSQISFVSVLQINMAEIWSKDLRIVVPTENEALNIIASDEIGIFSPDLVKPLFEPITLELEK
jgi:hypothetical protein